MLKIVNMVPASMSGETSQDSEPNLAINPENPKQMVATAFTPGPLGGPNAPVYLTSDGGNSWSLVNIVPGHGSVGTGDITVAFAGKGGMLYAGTLNGATGRLNILRTSSPTTLMTTLVDRDNEDQPWVVAGTLVVGAAQHDRVFIGNNDFNQPGGKTATVDLSHDAATAAAPAGFSPKQIEKSATMGQDGPPVRIALHPNGTVYAAFQRWVSGTTANLSTEIVVTRDDNWGSGATPFSVLKDSGNQSVGQRVATNRFVRFNATMGQERLGSDLAIAVDPNNSATVCVAWCDRVGGAAGTDWTVHVSRSTDKGQTWSADIRTITNAKNPALAINSNGAIGLLYQLFTGTTWDSKLEITSNAWSTAVIPLVLHTAPSNTPARLFFPYLGDYVRLLSLGTHFYGVFSGANTPDLAHFPNGVTYQRAANWTTHTLLNTDGVTPVAVSIDPFFFHWSDLVVPRGPINRGPITRGPINRGPITRGPIVPQPPQPIEPPQPIGPGVESQARPRPVTDLDL